MKVIELEYDAIYEVEYLYVGDIEDRSFLDLFLVIFIEIDII